MIKDVFDCRSAINDSCQDIEALRDIRRNPQEWNSLDNIRTILRPFKKFTEYVSRDLCSIQMLARMYNEVGLLLHQIKNKEHHYTQIDDGLVSAVKKGIKVFNKY